MREKMIAIAGRLRARAAEPNTGIITKDILNRIATEIEEELEAPPTLRDELTPDDPEGEGEIWGPNAPTLGTTKSKETIE